MGNKENRQKEYVGRQAAEAEHHAEQIASQLSSFVFSDEFPKILKRMGDDAINQARDILIEESIRRENA